MRLEHACQWRRGGKLYPFDHLLLRNAGDNKAMKIGESSIEYLLIFGDRVRTWHAAQGNLLNVIHRLQVDAVNLAISHGRDEHVLVISGVVAVVGHLDGQGLNHPMES